MLKVLLLKTMGLMGGMHGICEHIYLIKTYRNPNRVIKELHKCFYKVGCVLFYLYALKISSRDV